MVEPVKELLPKATQVFLEPKSYKDWRCIESEIDLVENEFWNQVKVVNRGQPLSLTIGEILIQLEVHSIKPDHQVALLSSFTELVISPVREDSRLDPRDTRNDANDDSTGLTPTLDSASKGNVSRSPLILQLETLLERNKEISTSYLIYGNRGSSVLQYFEPRGIRFQVGKMLIEKGLLPTWKHLSESLSKLTLKKDALDAHLEQNNTSGTLLLLFDDLDFIFPNPNVVNTLKDMAQPTLEFMCYSFRRIIQKLLTSSHPSKAISILSCCISKDSIHPILTMDMNSPLIDIELTLQEDDHNFISEGESKGENNGGIDDPSEYERIDSPSLCVVKQSIEDLVIRPIEYEAIYKLAPIRLPCAMLLYGMPGTGKTFLVQKLADHLKRTQKNRMQFIYVKGPELLGKYIGSSEQAVRDIFSRARKRTPCVLFFDEFDSLVPRRGADPTTSGGSGGVSDRVVNQFLTEMDGLESSLQNRHIFILAASNRPEKIDPAILRPGRIDKHILIPLPNYQERLTLFVNIAQTLNLHHMQIDSINLRALHGSSQSEERATNLSPTRDPDTIISWSYLAAKTENYTGADIQNLFTTAQLIAFHQCPSHPPQVIIIIYHSH